MHGKYFENLFYLAEKDDFESIFQELDQVNIPSGLEVELSSIKARILDHNKSRIRGTLSYEQLTVDRNKIREAILLLINNIRSDLNRNISELPKRLTFIPRAPQGFIGRKNDIEEIHELLQTSRPFLLLNGLGGIGKTTIVSKYVENYYFDYDHFIWVNVPRNPVQKQYKQPTTKSVMANDTLNHLSQKLGFEYDPKLSEDNKFRLVVEKLNEIPGNNLLIIDNAGSEILDIRESLISSRQWRLIIMSREFVNSFIPYRLDVLSPDDAKLLFLTLHPRGKHEIESIEKLLIEIGHHTLTLELLARLCETLLSSKPVKEILRTIVDRKFHTLSEEVWANQSNREVNLYAHLLGAFDHSDLSDRECNLLSQWALLPSEELEAEILLDLFTTKSPDADQFKRTLLDLVRKGWILKNPETGTYRCHQMIQEVIRYKLPANTEVCRPVIRGLTNFLEYNSYVNNLLKARFVPWADGLIFGLNDSLFDPELGLLYNNLSILKKDLGDYVNAEIFQQRAIDTFENLKEVDSVVLAQAYRNLARIKRSLGNYSESYKFQDRAIQTLLDTPNYLALDLANLYSDMALILYNLGKYNDANITQHQAIELFEELSESDHPELAKAYSIKASILQDLGNYDEAERFQKKSIQIREQIHGEIHPNLATSYHTMSLILLSRGNCSGAKKFQDKAIKIRKAILNSKHPNLASSFSGMASIQLELGNLDIAEDYQIKAIEIQEEILGRDHPSLAKSYYNMAMISCQKGDAKVAFHYQEYALKNWKRKFNSNHPKMGLLYLGKAIIHREISENSKALENLEKAIEIFNSTLGASHPDTIIAHSHYISLLLELGKGTKVQVHREKYNLSDKGDENKDQCRVSWR